jgi:hypothetical protein
MNPLVKGISDAKETEFFPCRIGQLHKAAMTPESSINLIREALGLKSILYQLVPFGELKSRLFWGRIAGQYWPDALWRKGSEALNPLRFPMAQPAFECDGLFSLDKVNLISESNFFSD